MPFSVKVNTGAFGTKFRKNGCTLWCGPYQDYITGPVDLVLTSPPYNIGSSSERKDGCRKNGKYDPKSFGAIRGYNDTLPEAEYQQVQRDFLDFCSTIITENGAVLYNHKNRHCKGRLISPHRWFPSSLVLHDEVALIRGSTHNHEKSFLDPCTERLYVFKKAARSKIYFAKDAETGSVKDFWDFPIIKVAGKRHCAPFSLEFARHCIRNWCPPGGVVCDPYSGSGTTMIAAKLEGRKFVGTELMKNYFDMAVKRYDDNKESRRAC